MAKQIILASASPRRCELMREAGFDFKVVPANVDETIPQELADKPAEAAVFLAELKARAIAAKQGDCAVTIVAADTIVAIDGLMLGKPADEQEAFDMLRRLSGRRHTVYTGVAIDDCSFCESTEVVFHELTDAQIHAYVATGEPFDKAGAYGIQGRGMLLVRRIEGDFYNVMGLPISRVAQVLQNAPLSEGNAARCKGGIADLLTIMTRLRRECPWDKEQTHESIRVNVIEEAYEVADAIDNANPVELCEELGDLLLQVVFHAEMAREQGHFDFTAVCRGICDKLIYRHPHIYAAGGATTTDKVLQTWEALKAQSKGDVTAADRLESVPKALPALMRGEKVGKRAASAGFDFENVEQIIGCAESELNELKLAILHKNEGEIEAEFGDVLFSCCNLGRFLRKNCEKALTQSINRFIIRFRELEDNLILSGKSFGEFSASELDELWQSAKKKVAHHAQ